MRAGRRCDSLSACTYVELTVAVRNAVENTAQAATQDANLRILEWLHQGHARSLVRTLT